MRFRYPAQEKSSRRTALAAPLLISLILLLALPLPIPLRAQQPLAPDSVPGQAVYVPFPVAITLDGDMSDWAGVPTTTVTTGTATSDDPAENGSFTFAVAADSANLYVLMTMPDKTIVTGQHSTNFWNEDSLEFYVNFSDQFFPTGYSSHIHQFNINPGDIGKTDPGKLIVTGTNSARAGVTGILFKTDDGWGFEAAVPFPAGFTVEHGRQFGFQADANGSSGGDRDVKLIWSAADTGDTSYQDPSVFGVGVLYAVGSADVPTFTAPAAPPEGISMTQANISINQVGYLPNAPKFAALANSGSAPKQWALLDAETNAPVASGMTSAPVEDAASGSAIQVVDFSDFVAPGTYKLQIGDAVSVPFTIGTDIYAPLAVDAMRYFYLNRSGIELAPQFAGDAYARPAGHLSDAAVTCWSGTAGGHAYPPCDYNLDASKGWYDAGDFGKYVVNGGIATWTLLNAYELDRDIYPDGSLNIPESGNGVPDILDEARWELDFMLGMQIPEGKPLAGMVHHKLHALQWDAMPHLPDTQSSARLLMPPSTAATYNLAAVAAQCARLYADSDPEFAARCLHAAQAAFDAAETNPPLLYGIYGSVPGNGGGDYGDPTVSDERYWAAAELAITTGDDRYIQAMREMPFMHQFAGLNQDSAMSWGSVATLGQLSLLLHNTDLPDGALDDLRGGLIQTADDYLARIERGGYRVSINQYVWGSNSSVMNNAVILAYAHYLTGDAKYLGGVTQSLDYLLGMNGLAFSFISGYGERAMSHPHHRVWGNQPGSNRYPPPPPGALAGGPNANPSDPTAAEEIPADVGPSRRYVDLMGSWSTNEVAINWNAPLAWVAAYVNTQR